jgi:hypothetical protein
MATTAFPVVPCIYGAVRSCERQQGNVEQPLL